MKENKKMRPEKEAVARPKSCVAHDEFRLYSKTKKEAGREGLGLI